MRALGLALVALTAIQSAPARAGGGATWVLPPGSETGLRQVLGDPATPWVGGWRWAAVHIDGGQAEIRFTRGQKRASVVLRHGSLAPSGAQVVQGAWVEARDAPARIVRALIRRLEGAAPSLTWKTVAPAPRDGAPRETPTIAPDPAPDHRAEADRVLALASEVEHLAARGDLEAARQRLAKGAPTDIGSPAARAELAALHAIVGDEEGARSLARTVIGTRSQPFGGLVLHPDATAAERLEGHDGEELCHLHRLGRVMLRLGRPAQAIEFLSVLKKRSPGCLDASVSLALLYVEQQRGEEAMDVIETIALAHEDHVKAQHVYVSALRLVGRRDDAIQVMEAVVRGPERRPGNLGMLLAMYLREQGLDRPVAFWTSWHEDHPDDVVAPFMVGVLLHYDDQFSASNRWLQPLDGRLNDEPRLWVYLAMNAFNLGDRARAAALLDRAAALAVVDPDVYYCRAEITRDTDRDLAIADLERYLALTETSPHASPPKQARVHVMLSSLRACRERGDVRCEGPWEHPRRSWWVRMRAQLLASALGVALLAGAALFLRNRRREAA